MKPHNRIEMAAARRKAGEQLAKLGVRVTKHTTADAMVKMVARHTGWERPDVGAKQAFLERFVAARTSGTIVPAPQAPRFQELCYDRAMREAAARAAAAQPRVIPAVSNVISWREMLK